jgi:phosphatidylinositol glycan class N
MVVTTSSVLNLQAKSGLPRINQALGWSTLGTFFRYARNRLSDFVVIASSLPFMSRGDHTLFSKFLVYFLGFGPCFIVLSISVEGLFYVAYSLTLVTWVMVESVVRNGSARPDASNVSKVYHFRTDDLRIALFFLFFVQVGFFGTGK